MNINVRCIVRDKNFKLKVTIVNDNKECIKNTINVETNGLIEFSDDMIMCLCPKCREMFFSTPGCVIKRVDKAQEAKDCCTYCNVRHGYDYYVC